MNPYMNQGNNGYLPNVYSQQNFLSGDMLNGFTPQNIEGLLSGQQQQFDQQQNPALVANMMAKRQMYGQQSQQLQQLPFNSPGGSSNPSVTGSPALSNSPQQKQTMMQHPSPSPQQQQQQWANKQVLPNMNEQQTPQFLMMKQQQQQQQQQLLRNRQQQNATIPSSSISPIIDSPIPPVTDTNINTKRVDAILSLNIELIRLCIESQHAGSNLEPYIALYQSKLQSNLTYLATMADMSTAKPGEEYKSPPPPDFSSLPPPQSELGKKIHELFNNAQKLFEQSPQQQQMLRQQAAAMQQQLMRNTNTSATGTSINNIMDPQTLFLRQNMIQQQQMNPNDLLAAHGMINPMIMNNMMMNQNNAMMEDYNVMLMMQQQQQNQ